MYSEWKYYPQKLTYYVCSQSGDFRMNIELMKKLFFALETKFNLTKITHYTAEYTDPRTSTMYIVQINDNQHLLQQ